MAQTFVKPHFIAPLLWVGSYPYADDSVREVSTLDEALDAQDANVVAVVPDYVIARGVLRSRGVPEERLDWLLGGESSPSDVMSELLANQAD